ncbi:MAG: hypothetical protein U1F06_01095 [Steroidobacteraceae bacterium]
MNLPAPSAGAVALLGYTRCIYGLHALSVAGGVLGSQTVIGRCTLGLPSLAAVIMNYARRTAVRGSWLEAHFRWQIRTFWFALLWVAITSICAAPLLLVGIGIVVVWVGFALTGAWMLYRVVRGGRALRERQPPPA